MNNFSFVVKNKVLDAINKYNMLSQTETVVVGFSGGADSVCLLHVLYSLKNDFKINLKAIHVNHGIRGTEAKRDELFCVDFCKKIGVDCVVRSFDCVKVSSVTKESLEECGRRLRYECFSEFDECRVATAHNANDNVETVIFNLSRGSSLKGACGIPATRDNVIRPLIFCSRAEIEGYCNENALDYVTDSSNLSDEYTRNKIRHKILPIMEEVNSSSVSNVTSFCENVKDVYDYLRLQASSILCEASLGDNAYRLSSFSDVHIAVLRECVSLAYFNFSNKGLDRKKINEIIHLFAIGGRMQLYGNDFVEVLKDKIRFFTKTTDNLLLETPVFLNNDYKFGCYNVGLYEFTNYSKNLNENILDNLVDCDRISGSLILRTRRAGDKLSLYGRNVSKTLKKLFNELTIPVEVRDYLPILCDDEGVVWVYSVGVDSRCRATDSSCNIMLVEGKNNG